MSLSLIDISTYGLSEFIEWARKSLYSKEEIIQYIASSRNLTLNHAIIVVNARWVGNTAPIYY